MHGGADAVAAVGGGLVCAARTGELSTDPTVGALPEKKKARALTAR